MEYSKRSRHSRNRTKAGRCFGFMRFKGVKDRKDLESHLDKILIGNLKLYMNLPKYKKEDKKTMQKWKERKNHMNNMMNVSGRTITNMQWQGKSYAQAVKNTWGRHASIITT